MSHKPYVQLTLWISLAGIIWILGVIPAIGQQAVPVIVKEVFIDRFVDRVEALGTLRANESLELTATVSETVTGVHFEDGQRVEAGAILVEMTNEEEHALIEEERSTLAEAKKQYDRLRILVRQGAASKSLLDQRRREYETARARLRATESKLKDRLILGAIFRCCRLAQHQCGSAHRAGGPHHHPGRRQRHEARFHGAVGPPGNPQNRTAH